MSESELTKKQQVAVKRCDRSLADNGLITYTKLEQNMYGALVAAQEAVELGKQLCQQIEVLENKAGLLLKALHKLYNTCESEYPPALWYKDYPEVVEAKRLLVENGVVVDEPAH